MTHDYTMKMEPKMSNRVSNSKWSHSIYMRGLCSRLAGFVYSEDGVVTVEWVALAAGLTLGAIAISFIVMKGLVAPAHNIADQLTP